MPHVATEGGPVLTSPKLVAITYAEDPYRDQIEELAKTLGQTSYWNRTFTLARR